MNRPSREEVFSLLVVAGLLLLTSWANAVWLLAWSAIGLATGLAFWWRGGHRPALLAAVTGSALALALALFALFPRIAQ
jgi:hypothetical protein